MLFDTHAHLIEASQQELDSIDYPILNVTADSSQWYRAITIQKQNPFLLPALGIHPWFVSQESYADIDVLENFIERESIFAVGEIGLDFQKQFVKNKLLQLDIFECQLQLAERHQLPVSIHVIKAHSELLTLLKQYSVGGVIHGLGASLPLVEQYLGLGFKIGVNGVACRSNANRYHAMLNNFSLAHFVLETDYPNIYLPNRAQSSLSDIRHIAEMVAQIKNITAAEVIQQTSYNARSVFGFKD
ncbi:TatD family hydrolase [Thiomicrorhabdus sp. 6S2-11]|uniref:TatD family hydrolase n=1 Tax=Thiomicrorhabdus marina TaxID=2818442 RepID=A0ABS3Q595_9GAMM|nr:TatD family hydrolase [Thiomicrorhabdus marina]MBO1927508.1 TatD family hydrolase [Thiomicrorhabdus marina]